ncbi:MAG: leucyl aminopeptidase [Dehalococcoidia bacterium]
MTQSASSQAGSTVIEVTVRQGDVLQERSELAMLATFEDAPLPPAVAGLFDPSDYTGKAKQSLLLYPHDAVAPHRLLLVGLGKADALNAETIREAAAAAVRRTRELQVAAFTLGVAGDLPLSPELVGQAFAEGIELGTYRFWRYRTGLTEEQKFEVERVTVFAASDREAAFRTGFANGVTIARGVMLVRDLVNSPPFTMNPARLADEASAVGDRLGLKMTVLNETQLVEQGFGGIMAVGKGSDNEPRFVVMEYGTAGADTPTICIVGKGITFDSGGLSIKPADAMETMKNDMSGAAAVIGTMQVTAELKLPLHVVGIFSAAENMPSGEAYRPGDIVTTLSGKTIEILNTDAEGRVVLSDALFYAQRYKPAAIVELSTLTGAMIIALGEHVTGLMATNQELADKISRAGDATAERVWQLPLWDEYHQMVKSEVADLKNMAGRAAGSLTAGAFLAAFAGDYPFAHLDIAGTAWAEKETKPYEPQGGTGVGVRLVTEFLREYKP